jgi:hypothetical protein
LRISSLIKLIETGLFGFSCWWKSLVFESETVIAEIVILGVIELIAKHWQIALNFLLLAVFPSLSVSQTSPLNPADFRLLPSRQQVLTTMTVCNQNNNNVKRIFNLYPPRSQVLEPVFSQHNARYIHFR